MTIKPAGMKTNENGTVYISDNRIATSSWTMIPTTILPALLKRKIAETGGAFESNPGYGVY
jgi:hypothetical protein